jgi:hypothetical protein
MEDKRIEMRKKQLEARAEQQAKAKLAAASPNPVPVSAPSPASAAPTPFASTSQTTEVLTESQLSEHSQQSTSQSSMASPPLHPSLPAKPGATSTATSKSTVSTPATEVPPPTSLGTVTPAPPTPSVEMKPEFPKPDTRFSSDEQLASLDQVNFPLASKSTPLTSTLNVRRPSNAGRGSRYVVLGIHIWRTSAKSGRETSWRLLRT